MDCLKRRDEQLKSSRGITSTHHSNFPLPDHCLLCAIHFETPIKLEFPKFGSLDGEDPIA